MMMANEEDECDSAGRFPVASQSDINSFLNAQAAKITGLNRSISDDDDDDDDASSIDDGLLSRFAQVSRKSSKKTSYLSRSCFASISSQKQNISDDLTELKWLNTFKFKEFQDPKPNSTTQEKPAPLVDSNEDRISKLSNELKSYDPKTPQSEPIAYGVLIFLALHAHRDDKPIPWSLTIKQIYEYIQTHHKPIANKRGWKNLLKQTLNTIPCFIKTKHDIPKSHSIWSIDSYYRPLLTKAYLSNPSNKLSNTNGNDGKQSESIVENFAPKATVKTKALPRLYERLREEKLGQLDDDDDEADSSQINKRQNRKRPRSTSTGSSRDTKNNQEKRLSSSSPWIRKVSTIDPKTSTPTKTSSMISKQLDDDDDDDEHDGNSSARVPIRKSIITTRSQAAVAREGMKTDFVHRRKSSPPKKRPSLGLPSYRPNTRINRKNIEQDLELLRQGQPLDLSNRMNSLDDESTRKNPTHDILDLSLSSR